MSKQKIAPGEYYIGDLCYAMSDDDWQQFIMEVEEETVSKFCINGIEYQVWYASTEFGDGEYDATIRSESVGTCPVDSGTIGIISVAALDVENAGHGITHTFTQSFIPEVDFGTMYFGPISIETGDDSAIEDFVDVDEDSIEELDFD